MTLRIALVTRDNATVELLVPGLERKGYDVAVLRIQRQILACARTGRPDVLIVDVPSLGNNGYRTTDGIRKRLAEVPTVLLLEKGHASAGTLADEFMTKPYSVRGLLNRVRRLAECVVSRELRAGPLVLDPKTRSLRKGAQSYYLRPKEAALLELFMRNAGKVLGRDDIMRLVWETDPLNDTRTLSVHVRWLREKIEDNPRRPRILRTVRGIGYRLEAVATPASPGSSAPEPAQADDRPSSSRD